MADVQLEHGYTKIANEILERLALTKLSPTQFRLILVIWRYTYGFNRKDHAMSLSFLAEATGVHKQRIKQELDKLIENNIIIVTEEGSFSKSRKLAFNKDYDTWGVQSSKESTVSEIADSTVSKNADSTVSEIAYQEINNKKNINKNTTTTIEPAILFEQCLTWLSPLQRDRLNDWINTFDGNKEIVNLAIRMADDRNRRNFNFVNFLLNEWYNNNLKTVEQIKIYEQRKFRQEKKRTGTTKVVTAAEKHGRDIPDEFVFDINAGEDWP
ncbi:replication protein [Aeribacillus alveayuensis]|uniref:replication protein n=1 Tax=Aeribacillus alveayuensis TaxID=279215 RepID=UPI000697EC92|nr:replication protein [Bacillus alveayuensis]